MPGVTYAAGEAFGGCPVRPVAGAEVAQPADLRSTHGELRVDLRYRTDVGADRRTRHCYVTETGAEAPTLRLKPGDLLVIRLKNDGVAASPMDMKPTSMRSDPRGCTTGVMTATRPIFIPRYFRPAALPSGRCAAQGRCADRYFIGRR